MRRALLLSAAAALLAGCGGDRLSSDDLPRAPATLQLSSAAFADGEELPRRYTCDGAGEEPEVRVADVPPEARELVLVVSDPDAPGGTYVHLTRYEIDPGGGLDRGQEGRNSAGKGGWSPPCPPEGDDPHRYVWSVYALREPSRLSHGADPGEVTDALADDLLAGGTLTARYGR